MNPKLTLVQHHKQLSIAIGLILLNMMLFGATNPLSSSVAVIIFGFLLMALDIACIIYIALRLLAGVFPYVRSRFRRLNAILAGFGVVLLALSSIGQLTWRDVLAVVAVALVVYFYSMYFRLGARRSQ